MGMKKGTLTRSSGQGGEKDDEAVGFHDDALMKFVCGER